MQNNPFLLIEEGNLMIKVKAGEIVALVLNKAQQHINNIVKQLWKENKPIRLIVLKARQVGSTTDFMAIIYSIVSQRHSQTAAIIADEKGKANDIFEMAKLFQERCPMHLRPNIKKSNERKLEFEGTHSQIVIDTAENKDAGRSATLRYVLLSEYAYYRKANAEAIMLGISHSVPSLGRTIIIKESTANGYNHFKDEWDAAVAGENDYTAIFIPWYWDDGYMMKVVDDFKIGDAAEGEVSKDEPSLSRQMAKENIIYIEERLAWRRWDIKNNCANNVDRFRQENPSTAEEAFLASGQCFFEQKRLIEWLKLKRKPLFTANIVKENFKWVLRKCDDGDFIFFEEPTSYAQYCIGGDACSGSGTDFSPLIALNKETNKEAAIFYGKADPDELAYKAMCLGNLLNGALVAIENDKFGFAANEKLRTIYSNIYVQRTFNNIENKTIEKFGWDTNASTRPMMLAQLQEEIREGSTEILFEKGIRECLTFIKNADSGKAEGEPGKNDDYVMARAIAGQLRRMNPFVVKVDRPSGIEMMMEKRNAGLTFKRRE